MKESIPRNLVKLGSNSLVVTLPKEWINNNNLKKGDTVYAHEQDNQLFLSCLNKPIVPSKEIIVDLEKKSLDLIKSEIITAYINGYDIIKLKGGRVKTESSKLKSIIHDVVGLEIIQQKSDLIIAKELLDLEKTSIQNMLRRIDYIVRGMFDDVISCDHDNDCTHIYERDYDVNRLSYLVFRTVNKAFEYPHIRSSLNLMYMELSDVRIVVQDLERIGDSIKRLSRVYTKNKVEKSNKEFVELVKYFNKVYHETLEAFYKNDHNRAHINELDNNERIKKCINFLHDNPKYFNAEMSYLLRYISRSLRDISRITCNMSRNIFLS